MKDKINQGRMLDKEKEMVENNMRFVHYIVQNTFYTYPSSPDYEDMVSIGNIGLIKAVNTFDEKLNNEFLSYARKCIENEIKLNYRQIKKHLLDISLNSTVIEGKNGDDITLEDTIEDPKANFSEEISKHQEIIQILEIMLSFFTPRTTNILLHYASGKTLEDIGKIMGVSKSRISKVKIVSLEKIRSIINNDLEYTKVFSMTRMANMYQIRFSLGNIENVKMFLNKIVPKIELEDSSDLFVTSKNNEVTIEIPSDLKKMYIFIQIYNELYKNYSNFFDKIINHNNKRLRDI